MSFQILHSNRVETLCDALLGEMFKAGSLPESLFEKENVLVDNRVLGAWLNIQIAQKQEIATNIDYTQPHQLFWKIARSILGEEAVPKETPLSKEEMTWRLYGLLDNKEWLKQTEAMGSVRHYLAEDENQHLKQYQLAASIADLFDQYLVYRPDWILQWSNNKSINLVNNNDHARDSEQWQKILWQRLSTKSSHRAAIETQLLAALDKADNAATKLPMKRLFVFGMTSMPPGLIDMLMLMGKHIPVYVYVLNPCEHFWFDIQSGKELARLGEKKKAGKLIKLNADQYEIGNPLLASQGTQVKEFLSGIYNRMDQYVFEDLEDFVRVGDDTLLHSIQQEILDLQYRGETANLNTTGKASRRSLPKKEFDGANIPSIHIHQCHSTMREVEVLHDQIRDMLSKNKAMNPRDVVVMMPRVASYVGAIHAVFGGVEQKYRMDYHITDRTQAEESPLLNSFITLLKLPESRLPLSEVISMLEVPAVQKCFGLDDDGYNTIKRWLVDSGVRWGLDAHHREVSGLPAYADASWQFGLDRLMAGYAMQADEAGTASIVSVHGLSVQPYDQIEGGKSDLLDKFLRYWDTLQKWREALDKPATPSEWAERLRALLDDFFLASEQQEHLAVKAARLSICVLDDANDKQWYSGKISLKVIRDVVQPALEQTASGQNHWREGVKFCSLMPMRGVPFKTVYIMGMNMEDYPRRIDKRSFDLMRSSHRSGDRASRVDDRWLFLEALLSARDYFHVSYIGKDIHRNEKREPSVVLSELLDYCKHGYEGLKKPGSEEELELLVTEHPLQPFGVDYFLRDVKEKKSPRLISYNNEACQIANTKNNQTGVAINGDARWQNGKADLSEVQTVAMEDFIRFFTKPWDWFLKNKHKVYLEVEDHGVEDEETLSKLDSLDDWHSRDDLIKMVNSRSALASEDERNKLVEELVKLRKAEGRWPLGAAGDDQAQSLCELKPEYLWASHGTQKVPKEICIKDGAHSLTIQCHFQIKDGKTLIYHSSSKEKDYYLLDFYIRFALFLHSNDQDDLQGLCFFHNTNKTYAPQVIQKSDLNGKDSVLLKKLAALYISYYKTGLPFEPELSREIAKLKDGDDADQNQKNEHEDERQEKIEDAWNQEKSERGGGGILYDSKKRSYFGTLETITSASFRSVSECIWPIIEDWDKQVKARKKSEKEAQKARIKTEKEEQKEHKKKGKKP